MTSFVGNRRSLPDDVPKPRGHLFDWKMLSDYKTQQERAASSNNVGDGENIDAIRQQIKYSDVLPAFGDDDSFGGRFAVRQEPKFSDASRMLKSFLVGSVDGSFARRGYGGVGEGGESGHMPWLLEQRSATTAGWKRSLASNDIALDAVISKVKELVARRRQLEKWLTKVRFRKNLHVLIKC